MAPTASAVIQIFRVDMFDSPFLECPADARVVVTGAPGRAARSTFVGANPADRWEPRGTEGTEVRDKRSSLDRGRRAGSFQQPAISLFRVVTPQSPPYRGRPQAWSSPN